MSAARLDRGRRRLGRLRLGAHRKARRRAGSRGPRAFADDRVEVIASRLLLAELEQVLRRPKFRRYVDERVVREYVERIERHATVVEDPRDRPTVTRDPKDDYLVSLARNEGVNARVSGDRDLIEAGLATPPVWSPRELVERLRAS